MQLKVEIESILKASSMDNVICQKRSSYVSFVCTKFFDVFFIVLIIRCLSQTTAISNSWSQLQIVTMLKSHVNHIEQSKLVRPLTLYKP